MRKNFLIAGMTVMLAGLFYVMPVLAAENSYCEVVRVSGDVKLKHAGQEAPLQQGMMIHKGDSIIVAKTSSAELAFDPEWKNVTHLSENTRAFLRWLEPTRIEIFSGDLYAKLDKLPKGSSFEVTTPTAIAVVRGTRYRTSFINGVTTIYNDSDTASIVYVYHLDENGNRSGRVVNVKPGESTVINGPVEVYDTMLEDLQDARDRQDQEQLNEDLKNRHTDAPQSETPIKTGDGQER